MKSKDESGLSEVERRHQTVLDDFLALVATHPDKIALVSYFADRPVPIVLSYGALAELVDKLAARLLDLGVKPREFVSYQLPNRWEFAVAHLAALRVGASSNPIMPIYGKREIRTMLERTGSRVCIGLTRNGQKPTLLTSIQDELDTLEHVLLIDDDDAAGSLERQLADIVVDDALRARLDPLKPGRDDIDSVMFSSGTTGEPKGVLHSHASSYRAISSSFGRMEMSGDDVVLMFSPMGHATGFNYGLEMPLFLGCKAVFQDAWDPEEMLRIVERERVTWTMGSSAFVKDACDVAETRRFDTSSLRCFACGGAPIPPQLIDRAIDLLGGQLVPCWGMTEVGMATVGRLTDSAERKASSDGCALDGVRIRVVDDQGAVLPANSPGHLQLIVSGQHVGYFQNKALYEASFQDGWYKTGDLGKLDEDGYVRILGRSKELVIRGGENIPVIEIENMLRDHPAIADVIIVGVPDERLGERCHAVVVPRTPGDALCLKDLTRHLETLDVTKQFWPEFLSTRDSLPRTATGKIQRFLVRDDVLAGV
jgi:cyclohexanecarboxylate-CoA ligase